MKKNSSPFSLQLSFAYLHTFRIPAFPSWTRQNIELELEHLHSTSVQDGTYALGKTHVCATPHRMFLKSIILNSSLALSRPSKVGGCALPLSTPLSRRSHIVRCPWPCGCSQASLGFPFSSTFNWICEHNVAWLSLLGATWSSGQLVWLFLFQFSTSLVLRTRQRRHHLRGDCGRTSP